MRFSLREFLMIATSVSVGVPAFCFANPVIKSFVVALVGLVSIMMAVRAAVERDRNQATAMGFVIAVAIYVLAVSVSGWDKEDSPYSGRLPTTMLTKFPLEAVQQQRSYWVDPDGNRSATPPPLGARRASGAFGFGGGGGGFAGPVGPTWSYFSHPQQGEAMVVAHCLWALLLGYGGGKYAGHVYRQRVDRDQGAH